MAEIVRWEYQVIEGRAEKLSKIQDLLNQYGAEGWEAVASWGIKKGITADTAAIVLKRPVTPG